MILLDLLIGHENTIFWKKDFLSKHFYLKSNPPKRWKWKMYNTHVWIFKNDRVLDDGASVDVWIYPNTFHKQISFTWPDLISSVMVYSCADFTGWIQVVMCKLCSTYKNDILASAAVTQNKSGSSGVWYSQWFNIGSDHIVHYWTYWKLEQDLHSSNCQLWFHNQ